MTKLRKTVIILGLLVGMSGSALAEAGPGTTPSAAYQTKTVAEGLDHPWSLAFLPDGTMLVTERAGRLRVIRNGKLEPEPVGGLPPIYVSSQAGLFDVVPHPQFATNRFIYLAFASGHRGANATRVIRARFDGVNLTDAKLIFEAKPAKDTNVHYGGRMAFLADGTLLITLGDGFEYREQAQKLNSDLGKIVRIRDDGGVPADNPFVGRSDARPEIWSYGHRNVQGIVVDAETGIVYSHEHGPRGGDEINIIRPGLNYGWPVITTGLDYTGALITPFTEMPGMEQPLLQWTPSIAPAGFAIYHGDLFPAWKGDLLVSALAAKKLVRVDMEGGKPVGQEDLLSEMGERLRDVRVGPEGAVYVLSDAAQGRVIRLEPATQ
ncbi:MAG: PQQ-dependent sugar dehydrogenase [Alphaproteobacteria bacterium]|nr:PQQ-dependent sugar dehydrogenase [Alphaproteobacteria bacterium]